MVLAYTAVTNGETIQFEPFYFEKQHYSTFPDVQSEPECAPTPQKNLEEIQNNSSSTFQSMKERNKIFKIDILNEFYKNHIFFSAFKKKDVKIFRKFLKSPIIRTTYLKISKKTKNTIVYINGSKTGRLKRIFPLIVEELKKGSDAQSVINQLKS